MKCECFGEMQKAKVKIAPGLFSEGYKCRKCNKIEFNEGQMKKALALKEHQHTYMLSSEKGQ